MIKNEWKKLFKNPILILVLVVIMLIPSMYAGLFLSSMWDPYGDLDKLPVAVVNEDEAVEFNGTILNIGDTLVDNLAESGSLDFHFVEREEAEQGLTDGVYYMIITIPEDFSYRASTALDYEPERMQLLYETNPATNYVATKLSQSAMNKIQMSLQESVTESYIEALMENINTIGDGMVAAADGTSQILDGENQVADGVAALHDGTNTLRTGANALNNGARDLNDGANALADGATTLSNGANTLYNGTVNLSNGASALYLGSTTLQSGINDYLQGALALRDGIGSLYNSAPALVNGVNQVNSGAAALVQGQNQIIAGFSGDNGALNGSAALASGAATLDALVQNAASSPLITLSEEQINAISNGASSQATASITADNQIVQLVAAGLIYQSAAGGTQMDQATAIAYATNYVGQLASTVASTTATGTATQVVGGINQALPSTLGVYTAQLSNGASALNGGINQLYQGSLQIQSGLNTLSNGTGALASGAATLSNGVSQLNTGANTLVSNNDAITGGVSSLVDGASALNDGASALSSGARDLNNGACALSDGANTLADGTDTLYSGTSDLSAGAIALDDGVGELENALPELVDGTTELYTSLNDGAIEIQDTNLNEANSEMMASPVETVETQITTVANNGTAMAAYMMSVGLWVACLAFCLMYPLTEHDNLKNGFAWWASKASVLFPIAVVQAVVLVLVLKYFLGFNPVDMKGTMVVAILSSIAFMAIMYYFNALIGKVGSFIMLVFMVFQLAGSAGTYPIELSGPLAQALHNLVPFTYTVNAFRSAIGGGSDYTSSIIVLVGIIVVFTLLTLWMFQGRSLLEKHDKSNVHDLLEVKGLA
ncbi:MAG: YhgE/Pip domain-containing protein [Saccharofermentans sp.]|nr:YhgE/Pip domain-containing protein [Saccharofermentans sp.]